MSFLNRMPEKKETGTCEKHGEYEFRYQEFYKGKVMVSDICPKCVSDKQQEEDKKQKEREDARKLAELNYAKTACGISKRNFDVTFDSFSCNSDKQSKAKQSAEIWLKKFNSDKESTPSMMITGKVGTGKTLLASAIINSLIQEPSKLKFDESSFKRKGNEFLLIKLVDMVRSLKETWRRDSDKTERDLINKYSRMDLLIIDEIGMGFESETEKLFVFDVIDGRYQNKLPTILISNLNVEGIKQSIGDRAIDRLRDGGGVLIGCDWESFRR